MDLLARQYVNGFREVFRLIASGYLKSGINKPSLSRYGGNWIGHAQDHGAVTVRTFDHVEDKNAKQF